VLTADCGLFLLAPRGLLKLKSGEMKKRDGGECKDERRTHKDPHEYDLQVTPCLPGRPYPGRSRAAATKSSDVGSLNSAEERL
jgi:hypothetical protein